MGQAYLEACFHLFFLVLSLSVYLFPVGPHGLRLPPGQVTCLASDCQLRTQTECVLHEK